MASQYKRCYIVVCSILLIPVQAQLPAGVSLFFSEYAEGSDNNRYVEIFNSGNAAANLEEFTLMTIGPYGEVRHSLLPMKMTMGSLHIVSDEDARDPMIVAMSMQRLEAPFNGSNLLALVYEPDGLVIDAIGHLRGSPEQCTAGAWDVCGVAMATKDHTLVRKRHVTRGNGGHWTVSAGSSAEDCEWLVRKGINTKDMASHTVDSLVTSFNRMPKPYHLAELYTSAKAQLLTCPRYRPRIRVKPRKRVQIRLSRRLKDSPYFQGYLRSSTRWRVKTRPRYVLSTGKTIRYRPILVTTSTSTSLGNIQSVASSADPQTHKKAATGGVVRPVLVSADASSAKPAKRRKGKGSVALQGA